MFHVRAVKPFGGEILILVCLLLSYRNIPWHWSNVLLHWCSSTVMSALLPIFLRRDRSVEHGSLFDDDLLVLSCITCKRAPFFNTGGGRQHFLLPFPHFSIFLGCQNCVIPWLLSYKQNWKLMPKKNIPLECYQW